MSSSAGGSFVCRGIARSSTGIIGRPGGSPCAWAGSSCFHVNLVLRNGRMQPSIGISGESETYPWLAGLPPAHSRGACQPQTSPGRAAPRDLSASCLGLREKKVSGGCNRVLRSTVSPTHRNSYERLLEAAGIYRWVPGLALNLPGASSRRASGRKAQTSRPRTPRRGRYQSHLDLHMAPSMPEHRMIHCHGFGSANASGGQDEAASPPSALPLHLQSIGRKIKGRFFPCCCPRRGRRARRRGCEFLLLMMGLSWRFFSAGSLFRREGWCDTFGPGAP